MSTDNYTPNTEALRVAYQSYVGMERNAGPEFARWLAGVEREAENRGAAVALESAADALRAECNPLTNRQPDWRSVHQRMLNAAAAFGVGSR